MNKVLCAKILKSATTLSANKFDGSTLKQTNVDDYQIEGIRATTSIVVVVVVIAVAFVGVVVAVGAVVAVIWIGVTTRKIELLILD